MDHPFFCKVGIQWHLVEYLQEAAKIVHFFDGGFPVKQSPKPNYRCWWGFGSLPQLNTKNPQVVEHLQWINSLGKEQYDWSHITANGGWYGTNLRGFEKNGEHLCDTPLDNADFLSVFGLVHMLTRQAQEFAGASGGK